MKCGPEKGSKAERRGQLQQRRILLCRILEKYNDNAQQPRQNCPQSLEPNVSRFRIEPLLWTRERRGRRRGPEGCSTERRGKISTGEPYGVREPSAKRKQQRPEEDHIDEHQNGNQTPDLIGLFQSGCVHSGLLILQYYRICCSVELSRLVSLVLFCLILSSCLQSCQPV